MYIYPQITSLQAKRRVGCWRMLGVLRARAIWMPNGAMTGSATRAMARARCNVINGPRARANAVKRRAASECCVCGGFRGAARCGTATTSHHQPIHYNSGVASDLNTRAQNYVLNRGNNNRICLHARRGREIVAALNDNPKVCVASRGTMFSDGD